MTELEKAEAALAAFRNEVECPRCHRYIPRKFMDRWALYMRGKGGKPIRVCHRCWTEVDLSEAAIVDCGDDDAVRKG